MEKTAGSAGFDLFPKLRELSIPTLVIRSEYDLVPYECAARIARTIPGARFSVLKGVGHFSYLEAPAEVREAIGAFFGRRSGLVLAFGSTRPLAWPGCGHEEHADHLSSTIRFTPPLSAPAVSLTR